MHEIVSEQHGVHHTVNTQILTGVIISTITIAVIVIMMTMMCFSDDKTACSSNVVIEVEQIPGRGS